MRKTNNKVSKKRKNSYSKGFAEGINSLYDEIQLAFQWHRPSILLAIHNTPGGQLIAQQFLEKKLAKTKQKVQYIKPDNTNTDVIRTAYSTSNHEKTVFFISGLEHANQISPNGDVYRALNIHREILVEQKICAVFWLTEAEAANLPRLAPDFWAFRHRVIEFAPKRGPRSPSVPTGLFLWKEQLSWMDIPAQKKQIEYYENLLSQLPDSEDATTTRLGMTLKLLHLTWQLNTLEDFSKHFNNALAAVKSQSNHQYSGWILNIKGIKSFEDGDRQGARACFDQALAIEPNNSIFMINSCIAAHGIGKNREAILAANRAIKIDPGNSHLWHVLGLLYLSMGRTQEAVETMEKAIEKDTNSLDTLYSLAVCYSKNSQPEESAALLEKLEKSAVEKNILQKTCGILLSGNIEAARDGLSEALKTNIINKHQIMRDPNLHALLEEQNLTDIGES